MLLGGYLSGGERRGVQGGDHWATCPLTAEIQQSPVSSQQQSRGKGQGNWGLAGELGRCLSAELHCDFRDVFVNLRCIRKEDLSMRFS